MGLTPTDRLSLCDNLISVDRLSRDPGADVLLDLDGQVLVVDPKGDYWVKFSVRRVNATPDRPWGIRYSLTLHGPDGARLVGFDNAHTVRKSQRPGGRAAGHDHVHHLDSVRPYEFRGAAALPEDFWSAVDRMLKDKGVIA